MIKLSTKDYNLLNFMMSLPEKDLHETLFAMLLQYYDEVIESKENYILAEGKIPVVLVAHLDTVEEYDSIMQRRKGMVLCLTDDDRLVLLKKKYSYIKDAYELLGMEQIRELKYHTSHIQRLLISISEKMDSKAKVAKLLLTIPEFRVGEFIPSANIKYCLNNIYTKLGIKGKASIKDFEEYATIKEARKRIDGKQVRGYIIQYIKIK